MAHQSSTNNCAIQITKIFDGPNMSLVIQKHCDEYYRQWSDKERAGKIKFRPVHLMIGKINLSILSHLAILFDLPMLRAGFLFFLSKGQVCAKRAVSWFINDPK
jgi:hypothetical protein